MQLRFSTQRSTSLRLVGLSDGHAATALILLREVLPAKPAAATETARPEPMTASINWSRSRLIEGARRGTCAWIRKSKTGATSSKYNRPGDALSAEVSPQETFETCREEDAIGS
jgi:hypothetical protein